MRDIGELVTADTPEAVIWRLALILSLHREHRSDPREPNMEKLGRELVSIAGDDYRKFTSRELRQIGFDWCAQLRRSMDRLIGPCAIQAQIGGNGQA